MLSLAFRARDMRPRAGNNLCSRGNAESVSGNDDDDDNDEDPLCLSIGHQSIESISGNLFARCTFRNVHSDERGGRCGINWTVITLVALSLDIARPD